MSPTTPDPNAKARFTKGQVNRAGKLLLDAREEMRRLGPEQGLQHFDEEELEVAWEALNWWRTLHARPLSSVAATLRYHVGKEGGEVNGRIEVAQRLKRQVTMIDKLTRERGQITQMHDIGGVRAVLPSLRHVMRLSGRLRKSWTIVRIRDYVADPKESGYRAVHLIVRRHGYPIEVQLRTIVQDVWANTVEQAGRELDVGLKFGAGAAEVREVFRLTSDALARYDSGEISRAELRAALNDLQS